MVVTACVGATIAMGEQAALREGPLCGGDVAAAAGVEEVADEGVEGGMQQARRATGI